MSLHRNCIFSTLKQCSFLNLSKYRRRSNTLPQSSFSSQIQLTQESYSIFLSFWQQINYCFSNSQESNLSLCYKDYIVFVSYLFYLVRVVTLYQRETSTSLKERTFWQYCLSYYSQEPILSFAEFNSVRALSNIPEVLRCYYFEYDSSFAKLSIFWVLRSIMLQRDDIFYKIYQRLQVECLIFHTISSALVSSPAKAVKAQLHFLFISSSSLDSSSDRSFSLTTFL